MTKQLRLLALMLVVCGTSFADEPAKIVKAPLERSYIPIGFDDNDRVQVTVAGVFPDTCYRVASVTPVVDKEKKTIHIFQTAYHYPGICIRVFVPFSSTVELGIVGAANYQLFDGTTGKALGSLPVTRATHSGPDDYLYAAISDAYTTAEGNKLVTLTLVGELPDRCSELSEVRINYYPEVIVVQPITKRIGENCTAHKTRFIKTVPIDSGLKGVQLLHVRSLNGQVVNKLVDVDELTE